MHIGHRQTPVHQLTWACNVSIACTRWVALRKTSCFDKIQHPCKYYSALSRQGTGIEKFENQAAGEIQNLRELQVTCTC